MPRNRMTRLSQSKDADRVFADIRKCIHPLTVITRCEGCRKTFRFPISETGIYLCIRCLGC